MLTSAECIRRRERLGWSKAELARQAEIGTSTVRHFEAGRAPLSTPWLARISTALAAGEAARSEHENPY